MSIVVAILGLGFLVLIHELGHFLVSLALRMRPRRFYVGFPPAIWKTERGGIEYGIGAIPLGGMVKIPGMHRPAPADVDHAYHRAVEEAPRLSGPLQRLRNSLESDDHDTAREAVEVIADLLPDEGLSPAARKAAERGTQDIADALGPDAYWRAATWKRVAVIAAGPVANILLAIVLFAGLFLSTGGAPTTRVDSVVAADPAGVMGLRAGDTILAIDGRPVGPQDIAKAIDDSGGEPVTLIVQRDGRQLTLGPTAPAKDEGEGNYRLGFRLAGEELGVGGAVRESLELTGLVTKDIVSVIGQLVQGKGGDNISSPVGIVEGSSNAAQQGTESFLWVLGLLSLSIALLNLLPLLPLDGGHIVFAVIEGVRGRSVRREIYERVSMVGIAVVLLLFFIGLSNDVGRLS